MSENACNNLRTLNIFSGKMSAAGTLLLLLCLLATPVRAGFATADLAGTWDGFIQYMNETPGLGGQSTGFFSVRLLLNITAGGQVSGTFANNNALGSLSLSGLGALTGTLVNHDTTSQDATWNLTDGRMNESRDLIAGLVSLAAAPTICGRFTLMRMGLSGASGADLAGSWNGYMLDPSGSLGDGSQSTASIGRHIFTVADDVGTISNGFYTYLTTGDSDRHGTMTGPVPTVTDGAGFLAGSLACTMDNTTGDVPLPLGGARLNLARDGIIGCLEQRSGWIAYVWRGAATSPRDVAGSWRVYSWETTGYGFHRPVVADLVLAPDGTAGGLTVVRGSYSYPSNGDTGRIVLGSMVVAAGKVTGGTYTTDTNVVATIGTGALNTALDAGP